MGVFGLVQRAACSDGFSDHGIFEPFYVSSSWSRSSKRKRNLSIDKDENIRIALFLCGVDFYMKYVAVTYWVGPNLGVYKKSHNTAVTTITLAPTY